MSIELPTELVISLPAKTEIPLGMVSYDDFIVLTTDADLVVLEPEEQVFEEYIVLEYKEKDKPPATGYVPVTNEVKILVMDAWTAIIEFQLLFGEKSSPTPRKSGEAWTKFFLLDQRINSMPEKQKLFLRSISSAFKNILEDDRFS